jgi:hypothetical protein
MTEQQQQKMQNWLENFKHRKLFGIKSERARRKHAWVQTRKLQAHGLQGDT